MRITERDLEATIARINRATGNHYSPCTKKADGTFTANIGNYHLSCAYGGVALHQMSEGGEVRDIFGGHMPKKELYNLMHAYLMGMEAV